MKGLYTTKAPDPGTLEELIQYESENLQAPPEANAPSKDEVVIRVHTAACSVDDIHGAEGTYLSRLRTSPQESKNHEYCYTPGFECCGRVVNAGSRMRDKYPVGSMVMCFQSTKNQRYGTWGEYFVFSPGKASVDHPFITTKPGYLSDEQAVACLVPLRVTCANLNKAVFKAMEHTALAKENNQQIKPTPEETLSRKTIVIVGASGATGTVMLQATRHLWPESKRVAICSLSKRNHALENGATHVIPYDEEPNWGSSDLLLQKTDVVVDLVGGDEILEQGKNALRRGGIFETSVGPMRFIGDEGKQSLWSFVQYLTKILGRLIANKWRAGYKYHAGDMSMHANPELYNRLLSEKAIVPEIVSVVDIADLDGIKDSIRQVRLHKTKGRMVFQLHSDSTTIVPT